MRRPRPVSRAPDPPELPDGEASIAQVLAGSGVWALHEGDSLELALPSESIDAAIMDWPSGISFLGNDWDDDRGGMEKWIAYWSKMGRVAFDALKPGGHAAVWALPRTADWTAQALRQAGFEIRDCIAHAFGQGMAKSNEIGAHLAKQAGAPSLASRRWEGWRPALRSGLELWWIARRPIRGPVAANVLRHGTGAINTGAGKIAASPETGPERVPANFVLSHAQWDAAACRACGVDLRPAARFCDMCGSRDIETTRGGCAVADPSTSRCVAFCDVCGAWSLVPRGASPGVEEPAGPARGPRRAAGGAARAACSIPCGGRRGMGRCAGVSGGAADASTRTETER
jgi:hypothetical protein